MPADQCRSQLVRRIRKSELSAWPNFSRKWAKGTVRADIVARFPSLTVMLVNIAQRSVGNLAQLAMVIGIPGQVAPRLRKANVCLTAIMRPTAHQPFRGFRCLAAQPGQFSAPLLRGKLSGKSDQRNHRNDCMYPHLGALPNEGHAPRNQLFTSNMIEHGRFAAAFSKRWARVSQSNEQACGVLNRVRVNPGKR
jgi:hypothetical protein